MQIFPKEILEQSKFYYLKNVSTTSQIIYVSFILLFFIIILLLPNIYIDTYVQSRGIIKTKSEQFSIVSPVSSVAKKVLIKENQFVNIGDTLIVFDNSNIKSQIDAKRYNATLNKNLKTDLNKLILNFFDKKITNLKFQTEIITNEFNTFLEQKNELEFRKNNTKIKYDRNNKLHLKKLISNETLEECQLAYKIADSKCQQFLKNKYSHWESKIETYNQEINYLESELTNLEQINKNYILIAPVCGYIQDFRNYPNNSHIHLNQIIAQISPEEDLIAEIYVSPNDIGLIKNHQLVNFQIDSFNYREWGTIKGEVYEIGNDISLVNRAPLFKVRCNLLNNHLTLKNGYKGIIKKGMTNTASFIFRKRSLFNLLLDTLDDWLNPRLNKGN